MTCDQSFVGLDVGATTMKAAVVADNGRLLTHPISVPTVPDRGKEYAQQSMADAIRQAVGTPSLTLERIAAIGVATPGPMDISAGIMIDPPNMKPWKNVPVRQFIADTFQLPTAFQ